MPTTFQTFWPDRTSVAEIEADELRRARRGPTMTSLVPNWNMRPCDDRHFVAHGHAVRLDAAQRHVGRRVGRGPLRQVDDDEQLRRGQRRVWPSRRMPGACLMMSTSGPPRPLVISLSAPLRMTSARLGEPERCIAAVKPAAIDSTDTKTTTTPAMPTIATSDEPSRGGMVRRLSAMTASVCRQSAHGQLLLSASVILSRMAPTAGIAPARRPSATISADAEREVARRQHEHRQHAARRIAALHDAATPGRGRGRRRAAR